MDKQSFTMDNIIDLLKYLGATKIGQPKNNRVQFTCTIHNEVNASAGINIDYIPDGSNEHLQVFNCFACHAKGTIPTLVLRSLPDEFKTYREVNQFLKDRYGVSYQFHYDPETKTLKRYEDFFEEVATPRFEMPISKLAPFKSGKTTYQYFYDRGFTSKDVKEYQIGCDTVNETVTIPVFWEDKTLCGIIGRYIDQDRKHNERYRVYDFPKSSIIYPLDKLQVVDATIIVTEGMFDTIRLRGFGYSNAVSIMGNSPSKVQCDIIADKCRKVITMFDNDRGGDVARDAIEKMLSKKVIIFHPTWYFSTGKDPCDWNEEIVKKTINSATFYGKVSIKRYDQIG